MRLIGTLDDERKGIAFSLFLNQKKITHQLEIKTNRDWGSSEYGTSECLIWITNEEQVNDALDWYHLFLEHPDDPQFKLASTALPMHQPSPPHSKMSESEAPMTSSPWNAQSMGPVTRFILIGCCLLFFASQLLTPVANVPANLPATPLFSSPIEKVILYDYPYTYELVDRLVKLYGYEALQEPNQLPPEGMRLIQQINHTPFWQGIYSSFFKGGWEAISKQFRTVPMFEKIGQGQVWRLISPAFFHAELFHLFFNMLWLIVLGKQMENSLGAGRYIFFIIVVAIFSNTLQYLMSGPNFIGFSGVLCGMIAFIWIRQRTAPWEGYNLDKMTIMFIVIFILLMAVFQAISFFLEKSGRTSISPGIANTAHLSGALMGLILGKLNFFSWRAK
jgi:GlpG protein